MTQILTVACPILISQVSDRLVVLNEGGKFRDGDAIANKTIIYRTADAIVSLGYAGIAQIGNGPTDEWLVEILWGGPIIRGADGKRPAKCLGPRPNHWDFGYASLQLKQAIERLPSNPVDRHGLYLTIAGWQEKRGHWRPVVVEIDRKDGKTELRRQPRQWAPETDCRFFSIGADFSGGSFKKAFEPYRTERKLLRFGPDEAELALASLIRCTSAQNKTVGSHLLSVVLGLPPHGPFGCRFLPMQPHVAMLARRASESREIQVAHTPWIVGESILYPPSVEIGDSVINLSGLPFVIKGEKSQAGLRGLSSSIERPDFRITPNDEQRTRNGAHS